MFITGFGVLRHVGLMLWIRRRAASAVVLAVVLVPAVLMTGSAQAQTLQILHSFALPPDGQSPYAGLIKDSAGNLYGTTRGGGPGYSIGTVFKVDTNDNETVLHSFNIVFYPDGESAYPGGSAPYAGLIKDSAGNLYGTTSGGGTDSQGTVFKITPTGKETVLHNFTFQPDGAHPYGGLVRDTAGNLYGTTQNGGAHGFGTIFKVDTTGHEKVLHSFSGPPDGANPYAGLVRDASGNLYGTTTSGGVNNLGTVFKLDTNDQETVLHSFSGPPDGEYPLAGLILDSAGNLYGTTSKGGAHAHFISIPRNPTNLYIDPGTIFKVDTTGKETVLYSFSGPDGSSPFVAGLVQDKAGNLYGTTTAGGSGWCPTSILVRGMYEYFNLGCGTIFKLDTTGTETVLYSFPPAKGSLVPSPGAGVPYGGLVLDTSGNLYGTTVNGGANGLGTVFKFIP
jgi:uncharacterized repeat protein (TIGR03803 family)